LSSNWDDWGKYVGNALEMENLSRKEMEKMVLWGQLKLYLYNYRIKDLAKISYNNRKLIISLIKKIMFH
jgi:hypothetical protein